MITRRLKEWVVLIYKTFFGNVKTNPNQAQSIKSVADAAEPTMKMECSTGTQVNSVHVETKGSLDPQVDTK